MLCYLSVYPILAQSVMSAGWMDGSQGQLADREKPKTNR